MDVARSSKTAYDWKRYLRQLRTERDAWKAQKLERAASDWTQFQAVRNTKKSWEGDYFRECEAEDPAQAIHDHFQNIFRAPEEEGDVDAQLKQIWQSLDRSRPQPITSEEIRKAVGDCKPNKAVGPDGVPNEMLKCLVQDDTSLSALTEWFNGIFMRTEIPTEWSAAVLKLLAKIQVPKDPSHLRPIALSCHTSKVYATVITNRLQAELQPTATRQLAGKNRRACDFLRSAKTLIALLREWGKPAVLVKLDIKRAFDSLSRIKLACRIKEWCSHKPVEAASLISLLSTSVMEIHLGMHIGGNQLPPRAGVRRSQCGLCGLHGRPALVEGEHPSHARVFELSFAAVGS